MRYLLIGGLLVIIIALLYRRVRPYVSTARRVLRVVRDVRRLGRTEPPGPLHRAGRAGERLIRCDACGTWVPAARAVKFGSSAPSYCSHACLERAAGAGRQRATGGK